LAADTRAGAENPVKVLIVDDNLAYAQNIAEILEKAMTRPVTEKFRKSRGSRRTLPTPLQVRRARLIG
jgi:PleD family two-component response regulator